MSDSLPPHVLYSPWNSPGQNSGVDSLSLLQGIFPAQGSNLGLLHCRQILYQLSHKESPKILEWVAYPFSSGSSCPRNRTGVSCLCLLKHVHNRYSPRKCLLFLSLKYSSTISIDLLFPVVLLVRSCLTIHVLITLLVSLAFVMLYVPPS